jgi:hypothetical protein
MRLVVALAGVAALGLAGFTLMGRPSGASEASVAAIKPLHPVRKQARAAEKVTPKKVTPKKVAPKKVAPKPKPIVLLPGLTPEVAAALRGHDVVVVSLFDPQSRVDQISLAEASAGAKTAHAGFVPLDVLKQRQAGPLVRQLGVLPDPAVLVYRRPGDIVARFDGFADRDTVAQAVANAAAAATP